MLPRFEQKPNDAKFLVNGDRALLTDTFPQIAEDASDE
jgi:hypothetical protein